jgi:hypothetical protein
MWDDDYDYGRISCTVKEGRFMTKRRHREAEIEDMCGEATQLLSWGRVGGMQMAEMAKKCFLPFKHMYFPLLCFV